MLLGGGDTVGAASWSRRAGMLSNPVALLAFSNLSCWYTKFTVIVFTWKLVLFDILTNKMTTLNYT